MLELWRRKFPRVLGVFVYLTCGYVYSERGVSCTRFDLCRRFTTLRVADAQRTLVSMQSEPTRWYKYVLEVSEGLTAKETADRAGFDQSAMSRWKNGLNADVKFVVQFARAFNQNVLKALAEAEFITDEEANLHEVKTDVQDLTTHQLLAELAHRIETHTANTTGLP